MHAGSFLLFSMLMSTWSAASEPLGEVSAIRALTTEQAQAHLTVRVEGTLTFVNHAGFGTYGFIQQGIEGIYVELAETKPPPAGRRVRLHGVTIPGEFAPSLRAERLEDLGEGDAPAAATDDIEEMLSGLEDSRWVAVQGTVRHIGFDTASNLHVLSVHDGQHRVQVELPGAADRASIMALLGAQIRAEGVCGADFNAQRQLTGVRVFSPKLSEISPISSAVSEPRALPVQQIGSLLRYSADTRRDRLTRIAGEVTYSQEHSFVVQDLTGGVVIHSRSSAPPAPGQRVDVIGYAESDGFAPILVDATILTSGPGEPPEPVEPEALLAAENQNRLVVVRGLLRDRVAGSDADLFSLDIDGATVPASLPRGAEQVAAAPGALLEVEGVLVLMADPVSPRFAASDSRAIVAESAMLLLRSPSDIRVLRAAPFWSLQRVVLLSSGLVVVLLLAVGWLYVLRRQVRLQTHEIREHLHAQEAASRAKSHFVATLSHELRTPLHGIIGTTSVIMHRGDVSGEVRALLEQLSSAGEQLHRLIGDVLDLSQAEAGRLSLEPSPTSPRALVADCLSQVSSIADTKGIVLCHEVDHAVPGMVTVDPTRLRQILLNLLTNALKFTPSGAVSVSVTPAGPSTLRFEVRDTGPGLSEAEQRRLFQRFQQADASISRRFGGTGLGLSICQELAQLMGGDIGIESTPGVGSTFTFTVQAPAAARAVSLAAPPSQPSSLPDVSGLRVLVADDSRINRAIAAHMLSQLGCTAELVCDGQAAVDAAEEDCFDVIVMDLHMPVLDGLCAATAIRSALGCAAPPIIASTADALAETRAACLAAGFERVLVKPMTVESLAATLAHTAAQPAA